MAHEYGDAQSSDMKYGKMHGEMSGRTGADVVAAAMAAPCKQCGTTGTQGEMTYGADPGYGGQ